jgi:hypothetical protein
VSLKHIGCLILFLIGFAVFVVLLLDSICGGCVIDWGEGTVATASHSLRNGGSRTLSFACTAAGGIALKPVYS